MRTYVIEWSGKYTREVGVDYIEAEDYDHAVSHWRRAHASVYQIERITVQRGEGNAGEGKGTA